MTPDMETILRRECTVVVEQLRDWHYWFYRLISHFRCPPGRSHLDGYATYERDDSDPSERNVAIQNFFNFPRVDLKSPDLT